MITIQYNSGDNNDGFYGGNIQAEIVINDESTTSQAINLFVKALLLSGYGKESIRAGLQEGVYDLQEAIESSYKVMNERIE